MSAFVAEVHQTPLTGEALLAFIEAKLIMFFN